MSARLLAFASTVVLAPCLAADVIVVAADGSGDFTFPSAAANAAVSGDTLLIQPGDYGGAFVSAKSLVFVAAVPGTVSVNGIAVDDLTSSQRVVISGIDLNALGGGFSALDVRDCEGAVRVENGTIVGALGFYGGQQLSAGHPGVYVENAGDVAFTGCTLVGGEGESGVTGTSSQWESCPSSAPGWYEGGAGLEAVDSKVALHQCTLVGGLGGDALAFVCGVSGRGGPGLRGEGSELFLAGCEVSGGTGGFVDVCECGGDGGTTYVLDSTSMELLDSTFAPGGPAPGSTAGGIGPAPTLSGGAVVVGLPGAARGLVAPGALTAGQALAVEALGEPGDLVFMTGSATPGSLEIPGWTGPLLLALPSSVGVLSVGSIGAGGQVSASFATPTLPLGVEGATIFLQALALGAGGASVLTGSSAVTLISSSILP